MMKLLIKCKLFLVLLLLAFESLNAQSQTLEPKVWSLEDCILYSIENSPSNKIQDLLNNTSQAEKNSAVASFFPSLDLNVGAGLSFGRSIDPETNTYKTLSNFNNTYSLSSSLSVFNGFVLINELRRSKVNLLLGHSEKQRIEDNMAILIMESYINILSCHGLIALSKEKLHQTDKLLKQTEKMFELGIKSKADLYEIQAQVSSDQYIVIYNENSYQSLLLELKNRMNLPSSELLIIDTTYVGLSKGYIQGLSTEEVLSIAVDNNPTSISSSRRVEISKFNYYMSKGRLLPSISFSAGMSSNYFENLSSNNVVVPFHQQFLDNSGQSISFRLSIPIFNGLYRNTNLRRAKNNYKIAKQERVIVLQDLEYAVNKVILNKSSYERELEQMIKKTNAEEIAQRLAVKQYEEGLLSSIELQTSSNRLLESKFNLLKTKLSLVVNSRLISYYRGNGLY